MATKMKIGVLATSLMLGAMVLPTFGQADNNPPPAGGAGGAGGGGGGGGFGGRMDPSQFRQRMLDRLKEQLGSTDDEFNALQPKIEKVFELQSQVGGRGGFGRRGPGGFGGGADQNAQTNPSQEAMSSLRSTLENKDASPDEIKSKLATLREARTKAKAELAKAQQDLRDVLTQRQEAVLVMIGLLD